MLPQTAEPVVRAFVERADLASLALFMWAAVTTGLLVWTLRELSQANRRFDAFVRELARFNERASRD
ncbi:hypothetical protein E8L99_13050 [Phreatobacter aquaticus]|jgi:hypothetical protein|uniref:CcmD family protein n=1 Tax=Phreatobacter aquaticus TaxID=2570229 RepID=A0A4D7QNR0_9HYPH|nr:hypothetical protein [Phreatobacter aquaticus]QCK86617.1 hypothetical protein E8L99_13050 [Phreatobacter aquaticus]